MPVPTARNFLAKEIQAIAVAIDGETLTSVDSLPEAWEHDENARLFLDHDLVLSLLERVYSGEISLETALGELDPGRADLPAAKNTGPLWHKLARAKLHLNRMLGILGEPISHPAVQRMKKSAEEFLKEI